MFQSATPDDGLGHRIGLVIKSTREEIGWSQRELARRLETSQSALQRLESGRSAYVDVRLASAALRLLGIRPSFDAQTLGLAKRREQRDLVHAKCGAYASRRIKHDGWDTRLEVEVGSGRYRGWIDLLAYRAEDRSLLCVEIKTEIDDVGRIQRTTGWYLREAPVAARRFGWRPRTTTGVLLVLCSTENDQAIQRNLGSLRSAFPGTARGLSEWTTTPGRARPPDSLAMIDPRSRRAEWLRPTATEGRRTAAPYRDYRMAAAAMLRAAGHR